MAERFICHLCFSQNHEYFTINGDFRDKILKHLNIQASLIKLQIFSIFFQ